MTKKELIEKIEIMNKFKEEADQAKAAADEIENSIKKEMSKRGVETLIAGEYTIHWTSISSNRFDTARFKKEHMNLYKKFLKEGFSKRFCVSK